MWTKKELQRGGPLSHSVVPTLCGVLERHLAFVWLTPMVHTLSSGCTTLLKMIFWHLTDKSLFSPNVFLRGTQDIKQNKTGAVLFKEASMEDLKAPFVMGHLFKIPRNCETQVANLNPRAFKRVFNFFEVYTSLVGMQNTATVVGTLAVSYKVTHTHLTYDPLIPFLGI